METEKNIKTLVNLVYCFQTFRKINIATSLYVRWSKSLFGKWIYYSLPIIVFSINLFNLIYKQVLYTSDNKFTYINDLSNSLALTLLYFLSYFLSGYYPAKFDEFIKKGVDKGIFCKMTECAQKKEKKKEEKRKKAHKKKEHYWLLRTLRIVLFGIAVAAGYGFFSVAKSNTEAYWIYNLGIWGQIYYCFFLGITWYHSLSLLGMALISGFMVYKTIEYRYLIYHDDDFNKNPSILSAVDIVVSTFSYGLFYIIGSFLFIFNDRLAADYNVYNTFYKDIPSFILVLIVTILVVLAFLPLQELFSFMRVKKDYLIADLNGKILTEINSGQKEKLISKRDEIIKQNLIYTTITNKIIFILSVLIPAVGVILQGIDLFSR